MMHKNGGFRFAVDNHSIVDIRNCMKIYRKNPPEMLQSFVCYTDILGFSQLTKEAIDSDRGNMLLNRLRKALDNAFERLRIYVNGKDEFFSVKVFTDNVVVGYPIDFESFGSGESELGHVFRMFSGFQLELALEGFLVRGGIALGKHYMDNEIVFGDALLEAVDQDKRGGPPCISLAKSAVESLQHQLSFYSEIKRAPQYHDLLEHADGTIFLDYLQEAFVVFPNDIFFDVIEKHRNIIVEGLKKSKCNHNVWSKYEWVAKYHNFVCEEFANTHNISTDLNIDGIYADAARKAQYLKKYLIDIDSIPIEMSRLMIYRI